MGRLALFSVLSLFLAACGGEHSTEEPSASREPAAAPPPAAPPRPSGALSIPEWFSRDEDANTVNLTLVAGQTPRNNRWNFNGHINGEIDITVPVGATIQIEFINNDPVMAHSVGVYGETTDFSTPPVPDAVFEGAISSNPLSMTEGGMPGSTEIISFVASEAGAYTLVCYVPGHSAVGMWVYLTVSADGEVGVRGL